MNGSSTLEEADQKPFAFCPICLTKLAHVAGFRGQEYEYYQDLLTSFEALNINDENNAFSYEIDMFKSIMADIKP